MSTASGSNSQPPGEFKFNKAVVSLLAEIGRAKGSVELVGESLRVRAPPNALSEDLRARIRTFKDEIISWLREEAKKSTPSARSIRRVVHDRALPLSAAQKQLWFVDQFDPMNPFFNLPSMLKLQGTVSIASIHQVLQEIQRRHAALRTRFVAEVGRPQQWISRHGHMALSVVNLDSLELSERERIARLLAKQTVQRGFDFSTGPLLTIGVVRLDVVSHVVMFNLHHIAGDGWSFGPLIREVVTRCHQYVAGQVSQLHEHTIQYVDYAVWQLSWLASDEYRDEVVYWRKQLAGAPPLLSLPTDRPRPVVENHDGASITALLSLSVSRQLAELSQSQGVTPFMTLLAAYIAFLSRYSSEQDISVGTPIVGREGMGTEGLIGIFVNTLVLRTQMLDDPSFSQLLAQVRDAALEAFSRQKVPFDVIVSELNPVRSFSHRPLFQVVFQFSSFQSNEMKFAGLQLSPFEAENRVVNCDLKLSTTPKPTGIVHSWDYRTSLFDCSTIWRMAHGFEHLLEAVLTDTEQPIASISLLDDIEMSQLLGEWNDTDVVSPVARCIHQLFDGRAVDAPDAVALVFDDQQVTYGELQQRTDRVAAYLQCHGVGPGTLVGICAERSVEMVQALMGVMKSGGVYVPFDPKHPAERLALLLADAGLSLVLSHHPVTDAVTEGISSLRLDDDWAVLSSADEVSSCVTLNDPAYMIFTSGSTGRPKGVLNHHAGILNRLLWMQNAYQLNPRDSVLQKTPYTFDVSVWEFFWTLMEGARLVLAVPDGHKDPTYVEQVVRDEQISVMHFVPSMLQAFVENADVAACTSLRQVVTSGEALPLELERRFREAAAVPLDNLYGPTEAAVDVTCWPCREALREGVPIGGPIDNLHVHVLDRYLAPAILGAREEIFLAGVGLALGYVDRLALTGERFVAGEDGCGERMYRTGDLGGRWPDGVVEYVGRSDFQVKVRGFRIELGEIESVLRSHEAIREVTVLVREDASGERQLVAYLVADGVEEPPMDSIRAHLSAKLPDYMVPSSFNLVSAIPLTQSGKVDRNALLATAQSLATAGVPFVAPRTPLEQTLCDIWCDVLKIPKVGVRDDFFQIGGHSLRATQVRSRIRQELDVDLSLAKLFDATTIERLSLAIVEQRARDSAAGELEGLVGEIENLSDADLDRLLAEEGDEDPADDESPVLPESGRRR